MVFEVNVKGTRTFTRRDGTKGETPTTLVLGTYKTRAEAEAHAAKVPGAWACGVDSVPGLWF